MKAYGLSDVGKVRPLNEDAYYLPKERERFADYLDRAYRNLKEGKEEDPWRT